MGAFGVRKSLPGDGPTAFQLDTDECSSFYVGQSLTSLSQPPSDPTMSLMADGRNN